MEWSKKKYFPIGSLNVFVVLINNNLHYITWQDILLNIISLLIFLGKKMLFIPKCQCMYLSWLMRIASFWVHLSILHAASRTFYLESLALVAAMWDCCYRLGRISFSTQCHLVHNNRLDRLEISILLDPPSLLIWSWEIKNLTLGFFFLRFLLDGWTTVFFSIVPASIHHSRVPAGVTASMIILIEVGCITC